MKIIYNTYPSAFQTRGGGEIQLLKTMEYMKKYKKIDIRLFELKSDLKNFDIFHNFSLHRDTAEIYTTAKEFGLKTVLSPIYWNNELLLKEEVGKYKSFAFRAIKRILGSVMPGTMGWEKLMIEKSDKILPNSDMEKEVIIRRFDVDSEKIETIYNGVDTSFCDGNPSIFRKKYNIYDDFILFVGRIEPRKNIIRMIKAIKDIDAKLVIIGPIYKNQSYYLKCKSISNENVKFLGYIPHDSSMLKAAYSAAKVFVLPSIFETPGLAALEAALSGANIVITKYGSTKEYFDNYAWYVDPFSVKDIREKILDALKTKKTKKLSHHIKKRFTWDKIVRKLKDVYLSLS